MTKKILAGAMALLLATGTVASVAAETTSTNGAPTTTTTTTTTNKDDYAVENGFIVAKKSNTLVKYTGTDKNVVIPAKVKDVDVKAIGEYVFANKGIESVTIPDSVEQIGTGAFAVNKFKTVSIPASVKNIGALAFAYNLNLSAINVDKANPSYVSDSGVLYNKNKKILWTYPAGKTGSVVDIKRSVTTIAAGAFVGNKYIKEVFVHGTVKSIGIGAFGICDNLKTYRFNSKVKNIGTKALGYTINVNDVKVDTPEQKEALKNEIKSILSGKPVTTGNAAKIKKVSGVRIIGSTYLSYTSKTKSDIAKYATANKIGRVSTDGPKYVTVKPSKYYAKLKWSQPAGIKKYQVLRYNPAKKKWGILKVVNGTSYTTKPLKKNKSYKYAVKGVATVNGKKHITVGRKFTVKTKKK